MKVFIDGEYFEKNQARISVFDHGLLYGDGIFEGLRVYDGRVFRLREHIERLLRSAKAILLELPYTRDEIENLVKECVALNKKANGYVRLVATRGKGDLGVSPYSCPKASLIIIVDDIALYPAELYEKGIPIVTASSRRVGAEVFDPRVKSLNYLNNVLAKIEARQAGCLEAVMLDGEGRVSECTADNIFIIAEGALLTPCAYESILEGITRRTVMELAAAAGMRCEARSLTRFDLYTAEECFITGTGAELMPVTVIDGRRIGDGKPGPYTKRLVAAFREYVTRAA